MNHNPLRQRLVHLHRERLLLARVRAAHDAGMVGINVGIPVPVSFFPFAGHKDSFFGDNHVFGKDGFQFFTETKCVTTRWFTEADKKQKQISTWDGTVNH